MAGDEDRRNDAANRRAPGRRLSLVEFSAVSDSPPPRESAGTLTETSLASEFDRGHALLIYVGSPENGFRGAGQTFNLDDLRRVRFGRAQGGSRFQMRVHDGVMSLGIPLAWVSGRHADLSILRTDTGQVAFQLTDLESRNGTLVEGDRLEGSQRIDTGTIFEVGRSFWMVREATGPVSRDEQRLEFSGTANPTLGRLQCTLERLASSDLPLLLVGETGTGKSHIARSIHRLSGRTGPFVRVDMAAASAGHLLAAGRSTPGSGGLLDEARGGTLFIDELGELSAEMQAKLLCLTAHTAASTSHPAVHTVDVRIIAASTRDIRAMVSSRSFRPDLYARLAVYDAELLPLRARREDLGMLVRDLLERAQSPNRLSCAAFRRMLAHDWPFNVRELEQTLRTCVALAGDEVVIDDGVVNELLDRATIAQATPTRIQAVREQVLQQLIKHCGDVDAVAQDLSCDRSEIEQWLELFQLAARDFASKPRALSSVAVH